MKTLGILLTLSSLLASVSFAGESTPWVGDYLGRILKSSNAPIKYDDVILQISSTNDVELKLMDAEGFGDNLVLTFPAASDASFSDVKFIASKALGPGRTSTITLELLSDGTFSGTLVHDLEGSVEAPVSFRAFFRIVKMPAL